ncbi:hypothetical protein [Vreelandella songnenensis]|uniref:hypothetical protein n=1 Tax=Vreelandella songnenensis TaxID=1176243 RepID=UPI001ABF9E3D|nr:hypothetical protein [Halomonas songnenensis]
MPEVEFGRSQVIENKKLSGRCRVGDVVWGAIGFDDDFWNSRKDSTMIVRKYFLRVGYLTAVCH